MGKAKVHFWLDPQKDAKIWKSQTLCQVWRKVGKTKYATTKGTIGQKILWSKIKMGVGCNKMEYKLVECLGQK